MIPRQLIPVAFFGVMAAACRTHAHTDASAIPLQAQKLASSLNIDHKGRDVHLLLHMVNTSKKTLEVSFPSGQAYEFVVFDSSGNEVWRWGKGRMFTQAMRNAYVNAGDSFDVAEQWNSAGPGHYTAVATLTSSNFPLSERVDFIVP